MVLHGAVLDETLDCESSRSVQPYHELNGKTSFRQHVLAAVVQGTHGCIAVGSVLLCFSCYCFLQAAPPEIKQPPKAVPVVLVDGQQYTDVQYLGMNLFTAPGTEVDGCFDYHAEMDQCYLGSSTVREDVTRRMEIMLEAIDRAFKSEHWDRRPTTLKIVLLPEFFWRGKQGAYRIKRGLENVTPYSPLDLSSICARTLQTLADR